MLFRKIIAQVIYSIIFFVVCPTLLIADQEIDLGKDKLKVEEKNGAVSLSVKKASFKKYEAFKIEDPTRIVIDLYGEGSKVIKPVTLDSELVSKIRFGIHDEKLRIVVDVTKDAGLVNFDDSFSRSRDFNISISLKESALDTKPTTEPAKELAVTSSVKKEAKPAKKTESRRQELKKKREKARSEKSQDPKAVSNTKTEVKKEKIDTETKPEAQTKEESKKMPVEQPQESTVIEKTKETESQLEVMVPEVVANTKRGIADQSPDLSEKRLEPPKEIAAESEKEESNDAQKLQEELDETVIEGETEKDSKELADQLIDTLPESEKVAPEYDPAEALQNVLGDDASDSLAPEDIAILVLMALVALMIYFLGKKGVTHSYQNAATVPNVFEMPDPLQNCYDVLGCNPGDSNEDIKARYKHLMKVYHRDKLSANDIPEEVRLLSERQLQKVRDAYQTLKESRGF